MDRVILHVDMDAFYASVEIRDNPELAGKPLIIGHRGRRGVVSTCSYEARRHGVRSAMPSLTAERLCPEAIWLPGRMALYVEVSRRIRALLQRYSPRVEPVSIDEAFLDLTGIASDLSAGTRSAVDLKQRIRDSERLTASVGVAPNKFLAKLASDLDKPDGLTTLSLADLPDRVWPLPVERLWGVGPATARRLRGRGIVTVGGLLSTPPAELDALVGAATASRLRELSRGVDDRAVEPGREHKSISEERTYGRDLTDPEAIDRALLARAEGVAYQLRREGLVARTVHLKVRSGDYTTWTRSVTLASPTDLAEDLVRAARSLYSARIHLGSKGVRLLGLGTSGLSPAVSAHVSLLDDLPARRVAQAADAVREKLGPAAVVRARLLGSPRPRRGSDRREDPDEEASSLPSVD